MYFDTCIQPEIAAVDYEDGTCRVFDFHLSAHRNLWAAITHAKTHPGKIVVRQGAKKMVYIDGTVQD